MAYDILKAALAKKQAANAPVKKGYDKHSARIDNSTRLFGKYFRALWN